MPISGDTTLYTNRTVDINIFGSIDGEDRSIQIDSLTFGNPSQYVTGVQKLVQRYAICLLTNVGTQPNYADFGTSLLATLNMTSKSISISTANHLFNFANMYVLNLFRTYQQGNPNLPLDEQLDSATLLNFSAVSDTINLSIQITTKAGTTVPFVLPLPKK